MLSNFDESGKIRVLKNDQAAYRYQKFEGIDDIELWKLFKNGNREAFSYIYKKNIQSLFAFGQQIVDDKETIKDCIHNLFVDISQPTKNNREVKSIKSYLYKSLYRLLISASKKKNRFRLVSNKEEFEGFNLKFSEEITLVDSENLKARKKRIKAIVNDLPKKQREAFMCFFYEGLTYEEIASIMGLVRVHSARKLIYKAISKIKEEANKTITLISSIVLVIFIIAWLLSN